MEASKTSCPLPEAFVERITAELGAAGAEALCRALEEPATVGVRLHPSKCTALPEVPAAAGPEPVAWSEGGYRLSTRPLFTTDPAFHAGTYYVQEPGSQFAGWLLRQTMPVWERLLDLCAAPGGKTTCYASLAGSRGVVVANEIDGRRARVLADNVRKWGTGNVAVTNDEPARFAALEGWFDVLAVDAPCSGEGMFRKMPEARAEWTPGAPALCAARQAKILDDAWEALRPGGLLLYSTCTFNRLENEGVLEAFCERRGDGVEPVEPVGVPAAWGIVTGRAGAFQTFRFFPHLTAAEGFFIGVARKGGSAEPQNRSGAMRKGERRRSPLQPVDRRDRSELERWLQQPAEHAFYRAGESYYACREGHFEAIARLAAAVRTLYAGVALGEVFKGTLRPDGALAFYTGLNRQAVPEAALPPDEALRYLRKEETAADRLAEGMNLLTAGGAALGFAKRIGRRVNNLYPNSLRIVRRSFEAENPEE